MNAGNQPSSIEGKPQKWSWELFREYCGVLAVIIALLTMISNSQHNKFEESLHQETLSIDIKPQMWDYKTTLSTFGSADSDYPAAIYAKWDCLVQSTGERPVEINSVGLLPGYSYLPWGSHRYLMDQGILGPIDNLFIMDGEDHLIQLPYHVEIGKHLRFSFMTLIPINRDVWTVLETRFPRPNGGEEYQISDIVNFLFEHQIDIYGNKITALNPSPLGFCREPDFSNFEGITSADQIKSVRYTLVVETATGKQFGYPFAHYDLTPSEANSNWTMFH